ncbi:BTAD domain-containing putative transcriptional regulator [Agromyces sp. MMS24-JH15]|uniref:AfsR/SARP family transcriptional regulator n=1 Tax=Agromyces sp. MMS24-JH15 TaxID=3243765 RepID=UPI0037485695
MLTDHPGIRVALLGPVLVEGRDGRLAEPPGTLAKAFLAALAGPDGRGVDRTHGVEAITDDVWGDEPPRNAKQALQTLVSRLRAASAEGLVESRSGGYALAIAAAATDVGLAHELGRRAAARSREGDHAAAIGCLDEALALWRGEPGLDLGASPAGAALADAAAALRLGLRELRARCLLDAGDPEAAIAELEPLAAGHPLDEHLQHTRLRALAAAGRRTEAVAAFAAFRATLRDGLGISPGPQLVALNAELLRDEPASPTPSTRPTALTAPTAPTGPLAGTTAAPTAGPHGAAPAAAAPGTVAPDPDDAPPRPARTRIGVRAAPNALIGRDDDVRRIESLLTGHRLVTILGTGGLGKTRLAQEVAGRSDAPTVVVVELASIRDAHDVPLALATTLGIREATAGTRLGDLGRRPELRDRIVDQLGERPTLLVVDNCEQVVEGAATWVADLLAAVPRLTVLATSRSPLEVGAEQVYRLDPLPSGDADDLGPAVRLFLERARAARPGASLPLEPVARLCERLDGLPLAIELAAARIRSMGVEQVEARLVDRFALLAGGDRSAPERQRTLLAVIEWSWALLTPAEQRALPRLAWFVDGFALDAAEIVLGEADAAAGNATPAPDALDVLDGLIAQSLLSVTEDASGRPRYRMLETVREFGQSRLDDPARDAALDAVDAWARGFASERSGSLRSADQLDGLARTAVEQDNLVAVLRRAIDRRDGATVVAVFACLAYFWTVRSAHSEIVAFSDAMLDATRGYRPAGPTEAASSALSFAIIAGTNLAVFTSTGLRALARLRTVVRLGIPLPRWIASLGGFLLALPDLAEAERRMDEMVEDDDPETAVLASIMRTQFSENAGEPERALRDAHRAHALATRVGDAWATAISAMLIAQLAGQTGDSAEALRWAQAARASLTAIGADEDMRQVEWMIAGALLAEGRPDDAEAGLRALADRRPIGADGAELSIVAEFGLAELARVQGRTDEAHALARRVIDSYTDPRLRASPWFQMTLAAFVAGGVASGWPEADLAEWAETLRRRALAGLRARPAYVDRPVLGTAVAGWAAWGSGHPLLADRAVELQALAEVLHSRQDLPALRRDAIARLVVDRAGTATDGRDPGGAARSGADRLAAARARVAAMTAPEQNERARALLAEPVPSSSTE